MNPWTLVGWIVAIFLLIAFSPLLWGLFVKLPAAAWGDFVTDRRLRRAKAGKVTCEHSGYNHTTWVELPCPNKATRQTPNGFYCEKHFHQDGQKRTFSGSVSYALVLEWYKPEFERRRDLNI